MARGSVLRIEVLADASKAKAELGGLGDRVGKFGKLAAVGAAAAGAAVAALAVSSVKSASRVQQSFGAIESIFGKQADAVKTLADRAATDVGLAASEYGELATVLGSQLKNMGTAANQLAPTTDRLIKQGADLAATFGGSTADAVSAVSSLLKGERDPIERYGVSIKAADVSARLAAQGLGNLTGKARAQAEATATLSLLTEQTAAAHGSFARESDTVAGVQQRLGATVENLKAKLGAGLLPVLAATGNFLLTRVLPAASQLGAELRTRLGPAFTAVSSFITGRVVPAAQSFISWYITKLAPGIVRAVTPVLNGLKSAIGSITASIQNNRPQIDSMLSKLKGLAEFIATKVAPVVGTTLGLAFATLGRAIGTGITVFSTIYGVIERVVGIIDRLIDRLRNNAITNGLGKVAGLLGSSHVDPQAFARARSADPQQLNAAAGGGLAGGLGGILANLAVTTGDVNVYLDGQPVRAVVRRELASWERGAARRIAVGRA